MIFIVAIHVLAAIGIILFPLPGWRVFLSALLLASAGGLDSHARQARQAASSMGSRVLRSRLKAP